MKIVATNRKAYHDYEIYETYTAGIELLGTEVKSARAGHVSLDGGYATVDHGEVFLHDINIAPYTQASVFNHDPKRKRKLLLRKQEIKRLYGKVRERGFTLIPLKFFFSDRGFAKIELALAKGKKLIDKREELKRRAIQRQERIEAKRRRF
ncbi:MAG: SsrA-binding protein SmpB [candidate division WOR-3 bacterium]|nr:SsrA-binding protein SmpB [candidate division WOR-3 bacterium]MCX7757982.1 SsrA-binding protein SmpB [candidate division WOR-3 bacterium]